MDKWIKLGLLNEDDCDFSEHNKDIGVYKAIFDEKAVYIGKATELYNGGFRKRLRDYTRLSDSARNYPSGKLMNEHKDEILIEIQLMEQSEVGIALTVKLEKKLISTLNPIWNELDKCSKGF